MEELHTFLGNNQLLTLLSVSGVLGLLFGFLFGRAGSGGRVDKAIEKVKAEVEEEKLEISRDLNKELSKVRDSIISTVEAYSSVAKTIQEKLPVPPELKAIDIEGEVREPLKLEQSKEEETSSEEISEDDDSLKNESIDLEDEAEDKFNVLGSPEKVDEELNQESTH